MDERYARCARLIARAEGLLVTAGAGIGVDSGLPDFRGSEGLWRAYPALQRAGLRFHDIACPDAFRTDPRLAWGFYGHRLKLYRDTVPNAAFAILQEIAQRLPYGAFVFTSNVDGQFQRAGFDPDRISECHGSIHHLQCLARCGDAVWPADGFLPEVDMAACRLSSPLPRCPVCHGVAPKPSEASRIEGGTERRPSRAATIMIGNTNNAIVREPARTTRPRSIMRTNTVSPSKP